eukprot:7037498-Lingulodinium_polyedra.AAC.1
MPRRTSAHVRFTRGVWPVFVARSDLRAAVWTAASTRVEPLVQPAVAPAPPAFARRRWPPCPRPRRPR